MKLFKGKSREEFTTAQTVPSRANVEHPFYAFKNYKPLSTMQMKLYQMLRESVPIIDASIYKTVRLVGGFKVECEDKEVERELHRFLNGVKVNSCGNGASNFISSYLEQLLTYGTAIGEVIPNSDGSGIAALYNASLDGVELRAGKGPLSVNIYQKCADGKERLAKYPELILTSVLNPEPGCLYGTSILKGLPFVTEILLKIYNTIGQNWERVGNVRFAVTYKPGSDANERAYTKERAGKIAEEWQKAMRSKTATDFISVGDVSIKVIGADNQVLDSQVPVRQLLEQIVAKMSIPPFLLGLSWSTTETMSTQQAYILKAELESYRRILNPTIDKICSLWFRLTGYSSPYTIVWDEINLKDDVRTANARLQSARAMEIEMRLQKEIERGREEF